MARPGNSHSLSSVDAGVVPHLIVHKGDTTLVHILSGVLRASTSSIVLTIILRKGHRGSSKSKRRRISCGLNEPRINNGRFPPG
jgi:hypothetical protein